MGRERVIVAILAVPGPVPVFWGPVLVWQSSVPTDTYSHARRVPEKPRTGPRSRGPVLVSSGPVPNHDFLPTCDRDR